MPIYFSEKELGPKPRTNYNISLPTWRGIISLIMTSIQNANFAEEFPDECPDGGAVYRTNPDTFEAYLKAEIPELEWPLDNNTPPDIVYIMDLIEFCFRYISKAYQGNYHSYYRHYHYTFNKREGEYEFKDRINRIFSRNGLGFELGGYGQVIRLIDPVLEQEIIENAQVSSDPELNRLLTVATTKLKDKNPAIRRESLEKLWDAWERLKTIYPELDKKDSITKIFDTVSPESTFREALENEARELTRIGNSFQIRHSERNQVKLELDAHIDYLFHRLYSIINLVLKLI